MGPFEMVVMIVAIVVIGRIISYKMGVPVQSRPRRLKAGADPANDAELHRLRGEVDQLSRRVQTLERLATDPAARLSDEIERLRDARS